MKLFTCASCGQMLHFENNRCTRCGHALAYLPGPAVLSAVEPARDGDGGDGGEGGVVVALAPGAEGQRYRLCGNALDHAACNWAVPEGDDQRLCRACRLNEVIPDLADPTAERAWLALETAKRRLVYTLLALGLPVEPRAQSPGRGLGFAFKQGLPGGEKVVTGHRDGLVTIDVAEADAGFRESTRERLGEGYRTLLGHFRHEIGHYYWARLVGGSPELPRFRELFGDERADYEAARARHYAEGAPPDWPARHVSAYASMHPFEDWAESWAHTLHMVDTIETARSFGLALGPRPDDGEPGAALATRRLDFDDFADLVGAWIPLTVALNSLNRSMGLPDPYPFVLSAPAVEKLRFVHQVIERASGRVWEPSQGSH